MVDNSENILVEFDYNNITIIDPNKVIDADGKVKERYVHQEDLVMYANLECKVLPRTKLAIGAANNNNINTISIASINFIKPNDKTTLDNSYTDELTGKDTLVGKGVNQIKQTAIRKDDKSKDFYIRQSVLSNGVEQSTNNGLLGITSINIRQGLDFMPTFQITLEDVKGKAMFESGNNSPYAAFFNMPYPMFQLTLKGFYGKAVKLNLMLQTFSSRYDTASGNFKIDLTFYTYKYTILSELNMGYLLAVPHMYQTRVKIQQQSGGPSSTTPVVDTPFELGYQKIREMYSEYKSKGLIPDDFPELTIIQLQEKLENFVKTVMDTFTKQNMQPLSNLKTYQDTLNEYSSVVYDYLGDDSWKNKYLDTENFYVLKTGQKLYSFKSIYGQSKDGLDKKAKAVAELDGLVKKYNKLLEENETVGKEGHYEIDGVKKTIEIPINIKYDNFLVKPESIDIDILQTYKQVKKATDTPSPEDLINFQAELVKNNIFNNLSIKDVNGKTANNYDYFIFDGVNRFNDEIKSINKSLSVFRDQIETDLTNALANLLQSKGKNGIGFVPNVRAVLAVIFANGEAFLRLMDDVHSKAWEKRNSDIRKNVVLDKTVANASQDNNGGDISNTLVYPWPQVIKQTNGEKGHELYELRYPGDSDLISITKGYLYDEWPEIEFVEEFLKGLSLKDSNPAPATNKTNELTDVKVVSIDAIEYPISNAVYSNKEEIKFFYEIYERAFLSSNYSRLVRSNQFTADADNVSNTIASSDALNIVRVLGEDNPFLIKKLKEYGLNSTNFTQVLKHISNGGNGESWQNFIRGIFNTSYIKNNVENSNFGFIDKNILTSISSQPLVSLEKETEFVNYISTSTNSNFYDLADLYPFTRVDWDRKYLANGYQIQNANDAFDTRKMITYNTNQKVISNFTNTDLVDTKRPITNFSYKNTISLPTTYLNDLSTFYKDRTYGEQLLTEGNVNYLNYSGQVSSYQTTSILNTPFFINSIQEGVKNFRNYDKYPYKSAAYLFINSLPLSTLREKFKSYENGPINGSEVELDYIFATLKKFGAIHKLPYPWILKIGSIWHRYKTYVETNVDIINTSWSGFNSTHNYDPVTNSTERNYELTINGANIDIVLEKNTILGTGPTAESFTLINTGFYPQLINDFNVFYQGFEIYSGFTDSDIQNGFTSGVTLNYVPEAFIDMPKGFDTKKLNRTLRVIPWSVFVNDLSKKFSYIFPSQGSLINQTKNECITQENILKYEISGNTSMYNGSVRLFWGAPNYGYFDVTKLTKPSPEQYMKQVFSVTGKTGQENFSINGKSVDYTNMSEIFSVFEKNVLDSFETEFLNFSKSVYDVEQTITSKNLQSTINDKTINSDKGKDSELSYRNFQMLFRELMKIDKPSGTTNTSVIQEVQSKQSIKVLNTLSGFLNYDIIFKYGNPSNFNKKLFYSFSNSKIEDPYTWEKYTLNTPTALPPSPGVTLLSSQSSHPDEWKALKTYVGYSELPKLVYSDSGSYITDFFIDMNIAFNVTNIINFAPIIKIYATKKLEDNSLNNRKFVTAMDSFITHSDSFNTKIINNLMTILRKKLPDVNNAVQAKPNVVLDANPMKIENWESFKSINDKWISGNDFKSKTLFEDVLLLDRASRNIGDRVLVDVYKLKDNLANIQDAPKLSMLSLIQSVLIDNHFQINNIPSYVNFYNVQDAVKNPIPRPEGSTEFANTLFGTFLNVDYRNSSSKLVCFYAGKPSEQLAMDYNWDGRKDDSFDLRKSSDNPLVENQIGKNDWDKSNKVVGFNVDVGPQSQSIFKGFTINQSPGLSTAESLEVETQMSNLYGNRKSSTQNLSLYNLYKNRSYNCTITMMGNAMIQPTMYFNLRHVPMFSGPYMILKVMHTITPGNFETIIEGIRQPTASLPMIDNYIQSLRTNLLKSAIEEQKKLDKKDAVTEKDTKVLKTNIKGQQKDVNDASTKQDASKSTSTQVCKPNVQYSKYVSLVPVTTSVTYQDTVNMIQSITSDQKLQYTIFATLYIASGGRSGLSSLENNYAGIDITQYWGQVSDYFNGEFYYCSSSNTPYATFQTLEACVTFLSERWKNRINFKHATTDVITKFWILNNNTNKVRPDNVYDTYNEIDLQNIAAKVTESMNIFTGANHI
jgi:hypothetical protein